MERKVKYPIKAEDYQLFELVGQGVSAAVYRALCVPFNEQVAIKILDFERNNSDLSNISREAQTMILIDHPNVLKAHCSFVNDHTLWVVMPYMAGGSCLHIMKSAYPNGFEEVMIATILREVLKGLEYLHQHGHIHRDVKAGNILVDSKGGVKLGDFGVSACLFDNGDRQRTRNTFVGTPCWMAPEVMEQLNGYDFKADIWSFGITALELAHGHAPFSKYPPMKVLLMTLQNAPPCLDYERDRKFSKSFKQMIGSCLVKDPSKRPTAHKLLKQSFFKQARSNDYIVRKVLEGLPTLGARHQALKEKEEELLAQKKMNDVKKEELSQNEYKRGISSWNFDIEDLKTQASLIPDNEDTKDPDRCQGSLFEIDVLHDRAPESIFPTSISASLKDFDEDMDDEHSQIKSASSSPDPNPRYQRMRSDISENELKVVGQNQNVFQNGMHSQQKETENGLFENCEPDKGEKHLDNGVSHSCHVRNLSASSCSSDFLSSLRGESLKAQGLLQNMSNCNGLDNTLTDANADMITKMLNPAGADDLDDKLKPPLVQQKGRFKVTSENVDLDKALPPIGLSRSHSVQVISQFPSPTVSSSADVPSRFLGYSLFPALHSMLQINVIQRDNILNLMRQLSTGESSPVSSISSTRSADGMPLPALNNVTERTLLETAHEREKELIQENIDLQWRLVNLQDEIQRLKAKNAQV